MQDFDEEIKKIKEKRSKMEMSEEGKERIRKIIEARNSCSSDEVIKYVPKKKKTYIFAQKIAAIFICCLVLSSCAFAGEWKDILTKIFYGQGANIEYAVDNGYVQNIDMDYVESNGIKIKADYFYLDEYYMYVAFDVVAEEEFEKIYFIDFEIVDQDNTIIFSNEEMFEDIFFESKIKRMSKNNAILLGKLNKIEDSFHDYNNLKININKIQLINSNKEICIKGNWNLDTKIDKSINFIKEEINYYTDSKSLVEKYKISYRNNVLNINIMFKEECTQKISDIFLQDNSEKIYNMNENSKLKDDKVILNFFIEDDSNVENLKLNIKYNDEIIVFYLKEIDS